MALVDNSWYVDYGNGSSTGYYAVTAWSSGATIAAGDLRRQSAAPSVGNERVFVCVVAGTTHATTEPTWTVTRGALNTDNTVTWQECTGIAAINGDAVNTPNWTTIKNTVVTLGQVIKRDNGASYQICTVSGTAGNSTEPTFSDTAGVTTADNTVTWTSLGVVGNFTGWQAPHARLANAFASTWGQAGNSFYLATEHAETQASAMTLTAPGTAASPNYVYSVTKTTVPPASANLSSGASITTTGAFTLTIGAGFSYVYGVALSGGSGAVSNGINVSNINCWWSFNNCSFSCPGTVGSATKLIIGTGTSTIRQRFYLNNTTVGFGAATDSFLIRNCYFNWCNTNSALTGTIPSTLFSSNSFYNGNAYLQAVDLSAMGSGKTLVGAISAPFTFYFIDCQLGASVTVAATPTDQGGAETYVIRSDSSGTNYRHEKYQYMGTQTVETTIVRTGGATDGVTPIAWNITTTANSKWALPFESLPIAIWNDVTSSDVTVTLYGIWSGGAVPNNDDIWIEAEYLGSAATPLGSFATSTKADNLATGTALASDSSTWGGGTTKFKMTCTLSQPNMRGPINIIIKAAKASTTFYIDPKPVLG